MIPTDALGALAQLAEYAFAGRVLLSLLPPGLPGRHGLRDLPATWAASHLLGTAAFLAESRILELAGLVPLDTILLAPWLLLALARWITLPGAVVPRHEPFPVPPGATARLLGATAPLLVVAGAFLADRDTGARPATLLRLADALALLALAAFALAVARRSSLGRAFLLLALAASLALALATSRAGPMPLALSFGAGSALGVSWLRRGDRRAAAIAAVAFAACALQGPHAALLGVAGLFALWLHTPSPSRRPLASVSVVLLAACTALGCARRGEDPSATPVVTPTAGFTLLVVAFALATRKRLVAARPAEPEAAPAVPGTIDPAAPQASAVRDTIILAILPIASRSEFGSLEPALAALLPLAPLLAIWSGLLLVGPEIPFHADPGERRR